MILNSPYITGSITVTGNANVQGTLTVTGSLSGTATSASLALNSNLLQGTGSVGFATTASFAAASGSVSSRITQIENVYATTGSNSFRANQSITGSLVVSSTITAQTLVVQTVTSSIVYSSGSNIFGSQLSNTQTFTGSMNITGSNHTIFGNVGIGTGSVGSYKLVVSQNSALAQIAQFDTFAPFGGWTAYSNSGSIYGYIGNAYNLSSPVGSTTDFAIYATNNLFINTGTATTKLFISSSGYVGIGNTTPQAKIHIGPSLNTVPASTSIAVAGDTSIRFMAGSDGNANYGSYIAGTQTAGVRALSLGYRQGAGDVLTMTVTEIATGIGGVGIGTSVPTSPLTIKAASRGDTLRLSISGSSAVSDAVGITFGSATYDKAQIIAYNENTGNAAGYLTLWTGGTPATTDMTERMRITSVGLVGIGLTNPPFQLTVARDLTNEGDIAAGQFAVCGATTIGKRLVIGYDTNSNGYGFIESGYLGNVWTYTAIQGSGGNVVIGQLTDPGYKLSVNGQPGSNGYTAFANYSDSRLKENITNLEATNILDKISQIRPVTFNYNELSGHDETTKARRISGFIAQELIEIFPDMVGTIKINNTEYYDTNLSNLNLYLVKAIQEQNVLIQELKAEITELKNK
jgi:hypothetical protein